ncbi:MAG: hypothetical protein ACRDVW_03475 [Acidimicrobiales bacterium]
MIFVEIAVGLVGTVWLVVAVAAFWIGLLGIFGAVRFIRCAKCGHLGLTSSSGPLQACVRCRHDHVLHPVLAVHHAQVFHHHAGRDVHHAA